jgi:hypothetical protein
MALSVKLCRGFVSSLQVQSLSETDQRRFAMVMMLRAAGEIGEDTPEDEIACGLRISVDELMRTKDAWMQKQLIDDGWNYYPPAKRRYITGGSTDRVRRWRQKQKEKASGNAPCNAQNEALHGALRGSNVTPIVTDEVTPDVTLETRVPVVTGGEDGNAPDSDGSVENCLASHSEGLMIETLALQNEGIIVACNAQQESVTDAHANVYVRIRNRLKNDNDNEGVTQKLADGRVLLMPGTDSFPRQMTMPGSPGQVDAQDLTRQLTRLNEEIPSHFRKEREMRTLRELLTEWGYEHVYWNIHYVRGYLESRRGNFWACLRKGCTENWGEATKIEMLAFQRAKDEERIAFEAKRRSETEDAGRVKREKELSAEADRVIQTLSAEEIETLTKEAVENLGPEDRKVVGIPSAGPARVRLAIRSLVMQKIEAGEMHRVGNSREPPKERRENPERAPSRKRETGAPPPSPPSSRQT